MFIHAVRPLSLIINGAVATPKIFEVFHGNFVQKGKYVKKYGDSLSHMNLH